MPSSFLPRLISISVGQVFHADKSSSFLQPEVGPPNEHCLKFIKQSWTIEFACWDI
jgi:hypothetical protein